MLPLLRMDSDRGGMRVGMNGRGLVGGGGVALDPSR